MWHKGEESGHIQKVHEMRLDCDADVLLLVAIIAAIALTLRRRKDSRYQNPGQQVLAKKADRLRVVKMKSVVDAPAAAANAAGEKK